MYAFFPPVIICSSSNKFFPVGKLNITDICYLGKRNILKLETMVAVSLIDIRMSGCGIFQSNRQVLFPPNIAAPTHAESSHVAVHTAQPALANAVTDNADARKITANIAPL
jgi:hypothetical protein